VRILIAAAAMLLPGCERGDWQVAPRQYSCATEQMKKVEIETTFCIAKTDYTSAYCYGSAIIRNCEKKP
jgi:hypothetical protein